MVPAYHSQVTSSGERPRQTPLHLVHERLGATMTSFAGWQMPLRYGSETAEHHAVRRAAGLFDLSHMGEIAVTGPGAGAALDYALTGYLSAVPPGRARYTMICAPDGGALDDLVVYRQGEAEFLVIANAANTATVVGALADQAAGHDAEVTDVTGDYALIAVHQPHHHGRRSGVSRLAATLCGSVGRPLDAGQSGSDVSRGVRSPWLPGRVRLEGIPEGWDRLRDSAAGRIAGWIAASRAALYSLHQG